MSAQYDIIFVGGGLANTLAAYRIAHRHPNLRLCLLERGPVLGGEHTWSFHTSDVSAEQMAWLQPFVTYAWPRQEIRFPNRQRILDVGYNSIASATLHDTASAKFGDAIRLNCPIDTITRNSVITSGGEELTARCVIDGRGLAPSDSLALGYQTFLGLEIETAEPHGQHHPIIMDATIDQLDGYRFVYTLPFADNRILIEDTYYNDTDGYDEAALETRIADYAAARGWTISRIIRRENGILPIVLAGDIDAFWDADHSSLPRTGLRAALFHPVTGYSVPDAVRVADLLGGQQSFDTASIASLIRNHSVSAWQARAFYRLLNRMLFLAAEPDQRIHVLERFYGLSEPLISRFYAGRTTTADQMRILVGKPPVPISRALTCLSQRSAWDFASQNAGTAAR